MTNHDSEEPIETMEVVAEVGGRRVRITLPADCTTSEQRDAQVSQVVTIPPYVPPIPAAPHD
ncbi:MAG: hypothetical protein JWN27_3539 [Candidatus Eremiobacteraeota bacterium]|nr:hypothetical protein [Candidatus Eremiobacteraeota bacterium]